LHPMAGGMTETSQYGKKRVCPSPRDNLLGGFRREMIPF